MDKTIGIIGAMDIEIEELKKDMKLERKETIAGMEFCIGTLNNTKVVLAKSGIGKVYAAACTQAMILKFAPHYIINIGVCATLTDKLKTSDIILGEKVLQYDMDTSAVGDPIGLISGINKIYFDCDSEINKKLEAILKGKNVNFAKGVVATGDKFINDSELVKKLNRDFNAEAGDMESGSIGHICYINNVPFTILRSISDSGDDNSDTDYENALEVAVKSTYEIIMELCS